MNAPAAPASPMKPQTLAVWRAIAAAGLGGIDRATIAAKLPGGMTPADANRRLSNLAMCGYARCTRRGRGGLWIATGKLPRGEAEPYPGFIATHSRADALAIEAAAKTGEGGDAGADQDADLDDVDVELPRRPVPAGAPKGVPNSVFALGSMQAARASADPEPEPAPAPLKPRPAPAPAPAPAAADDERPAGLYWSSPPPGTCRPGRPAALRAAQRWRVGHRPGRRRHRCDRAAAARHAPAVPLARPDRRPAAEPPAARAAAASRGSRLMSIYALPATLLLRIDAHAGEWVSLSSLVAHVGLPTEQVRECAERLVEAGQVHTATKGAEYFYGVQVEGVQP